VGIHKFTLRRMSIQKQADSYDRNWEKYSKIITEGKVTPLKEDITYLGKKFYGKDNPPFITALVPVSSKIWKVLQQIQADFERIDPRQHFFHPIYFHITLNELGREDQINLKEIYVKMREILSDINPFKLEIRGLNCFNYMIYAQVFDEEEILFIIDELMHKQLPFLKPRIRKKIPHISITEIKTNEARNLIETIEKKYREIEIGVIDVDEIQIVAARPYLTVGAFEVIERFSLVK